MSKSTAAIATASVILATGAQLVAAQDFATAAAPPTAEFQFTRLIYGGGGSGYSYGRRPRWLIDWPDAEFHFMQGLSRLTRIDGAAVSRNGDGGIRIGLSDDAIFNYPWLYAVEVGGWYLNPFEAGRLREYLLRGGFLMVDDFHGSYEWSGFLASMVRVFPDRPILEMPDDDEVLHVLYDLDQRIQIPGIRFLYTGVPYEGDGVVPHWRGIYDDDGRLMVAINFNMDLGDAWEHADTPEYPEPMTALAYRFAVNYVIYAITH
ncbi:MAG: DUF4159 domain-containing protein [Gammaproteobacteria bacterium]|nr:DUF4159 domain-containing protein [Gammaproteobacteria bacterium]